MTSQVHIINIHLSMTSKALHCHNHTMKANLNKVHFAFIKKGLRTEYTVYLYNIHVHVLHM